MSLLGEIERDPLRRGHTHQGGVLRFITAGSVDDGKSTLIGRLLHDTRQVLTDQLAAVVQASRRRGSEDVDLSLLTDGLEAEREQGITIDVAYRYFATGRRKFIIADTPGHEQYTRNMATAASTADAAVILLDATKGLLPQSKRHFYIARLFGVRNIVVAVNKLDLVCYSQDTFDRVREAFARFAEQMAGETDMHFVPMSALRGDMVVERGAHIPWYQGPTLLEALEAFEPACTAAALPFRLPVQLVQRGSRGRTYLGRIQSGTVNSGDRVVVLPSGHHATVASVRTCGSENAAGQAGDSVAVTLVGDVDAGRGDLLAAAEQGPRVCQVLDAMLIWLSTEPLVRGGRYLLKHGARSVRAKLTAVRERVDVHDLCFEPAVGRVGLNDIVAVTLSMQQPVAIDAYTENRAAGAFILIDESTNHTVAGGMAMVPSGQAPMTCRRS